MAGGQERILRRRIKSVESTKKITKAMELIAASRIVKAQQRVAAARPYSEQITEVIRNLAAGGAGANHRLLQSPESVSRVAFICVTADRGLCGAYNSNVIRATERAIAREKREGRAVDLIVIGKKAQRYFRFRGLEIAESFLDVTDQPSYEQARQIASTISGRFAAGEIDTVEIVYTEFKSAGVQMVAEKRLMPLDPNDVPDTADAPAGGAADYEYEPGPDAILERLLPRYAESRLFAALLDSSASEHAARQRAMKAASDNADDLKTTLSRIMNRARQDSITTEIMEIISGSEALAQGKGSSEDLLPDHLVIRDLLPDHLRS